MNAYLLVAVGGALGSVARFICTQWLEARVTVAAGFPWGTLGVNVLGSLAIGVIAGLGDGGRAGVTESVRQLVIIGVLGGFTTFSSFSLQTLLLLRTGALWAALVNVLASVGLCLLMVSLGWLLAQRLG